MLWRLLKSASIALFAVWVILACSVLWLVYDPAIFKNLGWASMWQDIKSGKL